LDHQAAGRAGAPAPAATPGCTRQTGSSGNARKPSLEADQIAILRRRAAEGIAKAALARAFGVSRETIYPYLRRSTP
jgi:DNA invertase Pin-like site-specific DNA recombinase